MTYNSDYPREPIGGGNPYYRCEYCKISDPQINGEIKNHEEFCKFRIVHERRLRAENSGVKYKHD